MLISTDKAVNPTNVMGATKRLAELVLQAMQDADHAHALLHGALRQRARLLGFRGAAVPGADPPRRPGDRDASGCDPLLHDDPEAAQLVLQAGSMAKGGDVFVLDMGQPGAHR